MGYPDDKAGDNILQQPPLAFPTRTLAELNSERTDLVRALLSAREACEKANELAQSEPLQAEKAQLLLSATVRALEDLDIQLAEVKRSFTEDSRYGT